MTEFQNMGWQDKLDRLELLADPALMPLVLSIRTDMELFAASSVHLIDTLRETREELEAIIERNKAPA